jgi:Holliday junction DNA helicase RuvB
MVEGDGTVTRELADHALTRLGVDDLGLDGADRRYLRLIAENYAGGPVGIETMSAALSESRDALEEVIEPFLLQQGLIQRTPRGRMLAQKGWDHLGMAAPKAQGALFE